jgi:endonuclease/exonuclease/phosphatase family metal-dependent hydrolase
MRLVRVCALLLLSACSLRPTAPARSFLEKPDSADIRIMTWNVGRNSIFPGATPTEWSGRPAGFARLMNALQPDVLCLEEVELGKGPVKELLDRLMPLPGEGWHTWGEFDVVIASRYPLSMLESQVIKEEKRKRAHAMALVDLPGTRDLYVVAVHNQSRSGDENVAMRRRQSDMISAWLRDARTPGGAIDLPARTPFVILGDMNVVKSDPGLHVTTLLTGDVLNDAEFGPDAKPDWDGTDLTDALPQQNATLPDNFTWRDDNQDFPRTALDRIIYSDSVLHVDNKFVVNTKAMDKALLERFGLEADDELRDPATNNYDHMPVVVDVHVTE